MKKTIRICLGLVLIVSAFTSCKKEYNCDCIVTLSDGSHNDYSTNIYSTEDKKQKDCEASAPESSFGKTCTVK